MSNENRQTAPGHPGAPTSWSPSRKSGIGTAISSVSCAFLCFARLLKKEDALDGLDPWLCVEKSAQSLAEHGPFTDQDRWEENGGYTPYSLALVIAGLICAAHFAEECGEADAAQRWRGVADAWNSNIENWLYVTGTPLAKEAGVEGYYMRIAPAEADDLSSLKINLANQPEGTPAEYDAWRIVSPDALALVRYGLRDAKDPRIENTVRVIDHEIRRETPVGPTWLRYSNDGYGEAADGTPFTGSGLGHGWPVLTGERAHYELDRGDLATADSLMKTMVAQSHRGGLFPEQIWDLDDVPECRLYKGKPTGSAMPLGWAHAEFLSLLRSLRDQKVFGCSDEVRKYFLK